MTITSSGNPWGVWGQDALVHELRGSIPGAIRHAYVISGPEMSGKSTLATGFAKALLCIDPPMPGEFCDECRSCRTVSRGLHPDLAVFDLAWQAEANGADKKGLTLTIDTVRQIGRSVSLRPIEGSWRVVVVDDVESMQETAQEAFLKTLEEPPAYTVLLLLTTDANTLLPTILSRCVQLHTHATTPEVVASALVVKGAEPTLAREIAQVSHGLVGWAYRALANPELREARLAETREMLEWIVGTPYARMVTAVKYADRFSADREVLFDRLHLAMLGWRSVLLRQFDVPDRNLMLAPVFPGAVDAVHCASAIDSIRQCIFDLESNVRPRSALQSMVARWPEIAL
jgi:DNA polymerase-3 subunit delta'